VIVFLNMVPNVTANPLIASRNLGIGWLLRG
jgi:hypothetical protein